ncbi:hypothetical protein QUF70_02355 [Desulfobacterales bacterium HSG17]|nr:hypothetical protein [Desulfobacterales bacterium HSG17]
MLSIQLSPDYEKKLEQIANSENTPKDEIIKKILRQFVDKYYQQTTPYELGKELFGKYGSGSDNLSISYKSQLKGKIHEKHTH